MHPSTARSSQQETRVDTSGELPAKLLVLLTAVALPAAFAYGIWNA